MESAKAVCEGQTILSLKPFVHKKVGIVTTGNEVYYHRIEDTFTPVIKEKLAEYDHVLLIEQIGSTRYEDMSAELRICLEQQADVLGTIVLD